MAPVTLTRWLMINLTLRHSALSRALVKSAGMVSKSTLFCSFGFCELIKSLKQICN